MTSWPVEEIPDEDELYYRVHRVVLGPNESLRPSVFREHEGAMSTDWERYSTAEEAWKRSKVPADNGIVTLGAGTVRKVRGCSVAHAPEVTNRAHTNVHGLAADKTRIRLQLFKGIADAVLTVPLGGGDTESS